MCPELTSVQACAHIRSAAFEISGRMTVADGVLLAAVAACSVHRAPGVPGADQQQDLRAAGELSTAHRYTPVTAHVDDSTQGGTC
jgi:hypothetical protein